MHRTIARQVVPFALVVPFLSLFGGCGTSVVLGESVEAGAPPSFTSPDAEAASLDAGLTRYCPSNKCPDGFTTCPSSVFACDVNLQTDINNCGACGSQCAKLQTVEAVECVDGRCAVICDPYGNMDCDGIADNGCETPRSDSKNCGACGNVCSDPDRPCLRLDDDSYQCGCPSGLTLCDGLCVDLSTNDGNCGACGTRCESEGDGGPRPTNTYYGCTTSECGHLKCNQYTADCDHDTDTGCEVFLGSAENCGACGHACAPGQGCYLNFSGRYECRCAEGQTSCNGACVDLATDANNCGSCGYRCGTNGICTFGTCSRECPIGKADCNGNAADGCEVNTQSDPRNCGGCGIVCDAIDGQACVGGRCTVEPCAEDDGGTLAR